MPSAFSAARGVLERAIAERATAAALVEVGNATRPIWRQPFGRLTFDPDAPAVQEDTIFDLASLTKVMSTAPLVMREIERGALALDDLVGRHIPSWRGPDRDAVSIRDLLAHCGGLQSHRPFYLEHRGRSSFEHEIVATPLAYPPRSKSVYSDLGFMLLGFMLDDGVSLAARFAAMMAQIGSPEDLQFNPPEIWKRRTAPTEREPWRGRLLVGEVHDGNAFALGGVAGHAGLFGTGAAVGAYARHVLQVLAGRRGAFSRETLETFITRRADVSGSSRALGWDTMLPTSSCGTRMSPRAFGHTGFTGTSLWVDPEREIYVVLLTNRVHPTRDNPAIGPLRRAVHDAIMEEFV